ncbi:alpha/beta hydrolase [Nonomuraea sp. 3-1Str]|uniref:alpha/beta hydrolase n=1 Tax=Nonomuraea sp. 3-1Str TaxID=2929801 RepID=UPI0028548E60|nr:alpha/beta hydrolase [Nonomuraea sp. 3-1Str]MDR8408287.1 alpha/beta hydrolase [Nonomuraea sp. 3-1Str]
MWSRALAVLAAVALLATGCTREERPGPGSGGLAWSGCGDGFQCAKLAVPLDHADPGGERIRISVIRLPATGDRIGSLVLNPGGPGGSGVDYARAAQSVVSADVRARFDIVGFDPRGVGASAPIECLDDDRLDAFLALDATPDDAAEEAALERGSREFAEGCRAGAGKLLQHVGTVDAARDMEALREALGDEKLTYLGKSYGTFLGAVYADLFPGRVRALVLDGAVDPALSRFRFNTDQAAGFEGAFRAYVDDCLSRGDCPFRSRDADGALDELTALLRRTDRRPLPGGDREVTETLALLGALTPLYNRGSWPTLTETLTQAMKGDGTMLLQNADLLLGRGPDGYSNQTEANMAVNCIDGAYPKDVASYAKAAAGLARTAPRFGPYIAWSSLPCAYWPARPTFQNHPLVAKGAPPILVVGTERDPATPYAWARSLAGELQSGVLLTYEGDGHTAYFSGDTCVDTAVDRYLITGAPPKDGTTCP